jgi:hypothetical protein
MGLATGHAEDGESANSCRNTDVFGHRQASPSGLGGRPGGLAALRGRGSARKIWAWARIDGGSGDERELGAGCGASVGTRGRGFASIGETPGRRGGDSLSRKRRGGAVDGSWPNGRCVLSARFLCLCARCHATHPARRRSVSPIVTTRTLQREIFSRGAKLFQIALTQRAPFC